MGEAVFILISVAKTGVCVSLLAQVIPTPFDLFSSFCPAVVPSIYTIYMGKDKYESKYMNVMMLNGLI